MTDSWGFLLQTLTASEAALLLLLVKAMFRDKLSPRWQFGIWSILGLEGMEIRLIRKHVLNVLTTFKKN